MNTTHDPRCNIPSLKAFQDHRQSIVIPHQQRPGTPIIHSFKMSQLPLYKESSLLRLSASSLFNCFEQACCWLKMRFSTLPLSSLVTSAVLATATTNLYVSSYSGTVTSLRLGHSADGSYSLTSVAVNNGSAPNPSWLTLDEKRRVVYALDEGLATPNGSITSYSTSPSGKLTQIDHHSVINGPVSSVVFNGGKALAVAHYVGSSITTYAIQASGGLKPLQSFTFKLSAPGTIPDRQDAPHPHEVITDPSDSFILVPDLGADLVRIFSIDPKTSLLKESTPFSTPPGSGPRHGAFLKTEAETYFFLVTELSNTVSSYRVKYGMDLMTLEKVFSSGTYGNTTTPTGVTAAEVLISPDSQFLLTSSRNDSLFKIPNFNKSNSTKIVSDTLQSWRIDSCTGELEFVQLAPAGGRFPRQFSVNRKGTLAAVGLQSDSRVVIVERDVKRGKFGKFVAEIEIPGQITAVIWDE